MMSKLKIMSSPPGRVNIYFTQLWWPSRLIKHLQAASDFFDTMKCPWVLGVVLGFISLCRCGAVNRASTTANQCAVFWAELPAVGSSLRSIEVTKANSLADSVVA